MRFPPSTGSCTFSARRAAAGENNGLCSDVQVGGPDFEYSIIMIGFHFDVYIYIYMSVQGFPGF